MTAASVPVVYCNHCGQAVWDGPLLCPRCSQRTVPVVPRTWGSGSPSSAGIPESIVSVFLTVAGVAAIEAAIVAAGWLWRAL